jgi:hypothetical protein
MGGKGRPHSSISDPEPLKNFPDSGIFKDLNLQEPGTSEEFPEGWVPAAILGTSGEFPGSSEVCTTRKTRMCVALGVCVKAWIFFFIFSYASTWSNITYGHTLD